MAFGFGLGFPRARSASLEAAIAALFPDVWYDPSDLTTLFQDSAGTQPVTALEQPVGLMLDKSRGLVLGPELVTNGDFSNGTTGWTVGSGWTIANGVASASTSTPDGLRDSAASYTTGKFYYVEFDKTGSVNVIVYVRGSSASFISTTMSGRVRGVVLAGSGTRGVELYLGGAGTIDNISVRELPGYHAYHTPGDTTTRPTLSRRINLLTNTGFSGAVAGTPGTAPTNWSFVFSTGQISGVSGERIGFSVNSTRIVIGQSVTYTANTVYSAKFALHSNSGLQAIQIFSWNQSISGATESFFVNGASSSTSYVPQPGDLLEFRLTIAATAGSSTVRFGAGCAGNVTGSVEISQPSIVPADLAGLPYQRVNTTTDYDSDASKFPTFLRTDGTNDGMQTNAIDFTGTDKMFVSAGVRKLSDAAAGAALELSSDATANNGAFYFFAPASGATFTSFSHGTAAPAGSQLATASGYAAPISAVISSAHDISGDSTTLRVSGTTATPATGDKGSGNFGNYPLYLFRRGGTTLPFNGWFYGGVIAGKTLSASQIALVERWLASKTKTVVL